jgi:hypothetical protein
VGEQYKRRAARRSSGVVHLILDGESPVAESITSFPTRVAWGTWNGIPCESARTTLNTPGFPIAK